MQTNRVSINYNSVQHAEERGKLRKDSSAGGIQRQELYDVINRIQNSLHVWIAYGLNEDETLA